MKGTLRLACTKSISDKGAGKVSNNRFLPYAHCSKQGALLFLELSDPGLLVKSKLVDEIFDS